MLATAEPETSTSEYEDLEDRDLINLYLEDHDERAFSELYSRYTPRLTRKMARKLGNLEDARDVVGNAWRKVTEHLHRFDPGRATFSTWIWTITMNLMRNSFRDRSRNPQVTVSVLEQNFDEDDRGIQFADSSMTPEREWEKTRARELAVAAVKRLPPHHQVVFVRYEFEGKGYQEIADEVGISLGTVKSRMHRAREKWRRAVEDLRRESVTGRDEEPLVRLTETGVELIPGIERHRNGDDGATEAEPDDDAEEKDRGCLSSACGLTESEARALYHDAAAKLPAPRQGRVTYYDHLAEQYGVGRTVVRKVLDGSGAYAALGLPNLLEE